MTECLEQHKARDQIADQPWRDPRFSDNNRSIGCSQKARRYRLRLTGVRSVQTDGTDDPAAFVQLKDSRGQVYLGSETASAAAHQVYNTHRRDWKMIPRARTTLLTAHVRTHICCFSCTFCLQWLRPSVRGLSSVCAWSRVRLPGYQTLTAGLRH